MEITVRIVQPMIHVVDMDIVEIQNMEIGLVNVNLGGTEHCVTNKQIVEYKLSYLVV